MPRYFPIALSLIAMTAGCQRDGVTAAALSGCYEVTSGPWEAPTPLPADADSNHRPPQFLHLTDEPADTVWARGRFRVRAPGWRVRLSPAFQAGEPELRARYERGSSWDVAGGDTLEVWWHSGFHGTSLRLYPSRRNSLRGVARVQLDYSPNPYSEATAAVRAERVACSAAPPA
jgi:hypothetical protein